VTAIETALPRQSTQPASTEAPDAADPGLIRVQVLLDRSAFSPGVIVGLPGENTRQAVAAWRKAHDMSSLSTFYVIPQTPSLLEKHSVEAFSELVKKYQPSLVVIDTFARASVGGDENSAKDMGKAISVLDTLFRVHDCSSLVIHHSNKAGGTERGSGAIRGAADATWEVAQDYTHSPMTAMQLMCRKMKDSEPPRPVVAQLRAFNDSAIIYPSALDL
jgi:hypothetical protein